MARIGYGEDIHELVEGRKLILAGVEIPFDKGERAHSDGDVVIHALVDALLGAIAEGDIGKLYPDNLTSTEGMNSMVMLKEVYQKVKAKTLGISNIDITIILEQPKLQNYIQDMRQNIADALGLQISDVSIKAKTNEGLGPIGEQRAVKAVAVVLLSPLSFII